MQPDDARALIAAVGKLPPELQAAGRRRVAQRLAGEGVVDLAEGRVYRFKHGWIPLTHAAALRVTHGDHAKANALLAKHHGSDGSHTARVVPSKHGGFNVVHRGELQANWNTEKDAVAHAAKLNATKASAARVAPSDHGGFNVVHKGKLQANWPTQAEADRHAARLNGTARPKVRTSERTLASRPPAMGRDKVGKGFVPQAQPTAVESRLKIGDPARPKPGDNFYVSSGQGHVGRHKVESVDGESGTVVVSGELGRGRVALADLHTQPWQAQAKPGGLQSLSRAEISSAASARSQSAARVQVRKGNYRGESGHLISGRDTGGRKVAVFVPGDRAAADVAVANIKAGRPAFASTPRKAQT